ncbi:MAG TPA: aldehyde dehydrogenase family protein [Acidimicrobiales bacterium]|nr:aldehyde dehydrogenase family protein [Acidimicrobiales bacterium]
MPIATVNPTTEETEKEFTPHSEQEVDAKLTVAVEGFETLRRASFEQRGRWALSAAQLLEAEQPDLARTLTTEMGKTFAAAKGEVAKCALALRWFAEHAEGFLADEPVSTSASDSRVIWRPMGPVLAVMPWNFPMWQVIRFAAPALMAGNVGLLKHSSNVPQTALALEDLFQRAGFPRGSFQSLLVGAQSVAALIEDPRVRAVTLTGSEGAGRSVAEAAGRALKKSVLELGGSDPFVVMPSADLSRAVAVGVQARVQNNGQSCIAAKRFIVHTNVYDAFEEEFAAKMSELIVGDPMEPSTEVGPLALRQGRDELHAQVEDARSKGASVVCGGAPLPSRGWYYPPTVITGVTPQMRVSSEEVFGPVAMLYRVSSADEAIEAANATDFGLGASVWTEDADERSRLVEELEAGLVFVNAMVASTPELPFGGTKRSGYGRELSALGIQEFCEAKSVYVA